MDGKYGPLYDHIHSLDHRGIREWHATFAEIERIFGDRLPPSSRKLIQWWGNDRTRHHAQAWMGLGWKTHSTSIAGETVSFAKFH